MLAKFQSLIVAAKEIFGGKQAALKAAAEKEAAEKAEQDAKRQAELNKVLAYKALEVKPALEPSYIKPYMSEDHKRRMKAKYSGGLEMLSATIRKAQAEYSAIYLQEDRHDTDYIELKNMFNSFQNTIARMNNKAVEPSTPELIYRTRNFVVPKVFGKYPENFGKAGSESYFNAPA